MSALVFCQSILLSYPAPRDDQVAVKGYMFSEFSPYNSDFINKPFLYEAILGLISKMAGIKVVNLCQAGLEAPIRIVKLIPLRFDWL